VLPPSTADDAIHIQAGANIILQSASAARPIWHQHTPGQRHFRVQGTLTIGNIQLNRSSQDPSFHSGGIHVYGGGRLYINHGGALLQYNRATQGGGIEIAGGAVVTIRGGTIAGNVATGIPAGSQSIYTHPLNNYDINFQLDSDSIEFQFIKTDNIATPATGTPVPGAVFQLYSWDTAGDMWVASGSQVISDANGLVTLNLSLTGQYRLAEVIPPSGFMPVFGHWLISINLATLDITITHHNGNPQFYYYDGDWHVGNAHMVILPLAGGLGHNGFFFAGFVFIFIGLGVVMYIVSIHKTQQVSRLKKVLQK